MAHYKTQKGHAWNFTLSRYVKAEYLEIQQFSSCIYYHFQ